MVVACDRKYMFMNLMYVLLTLKYMLLNVKQVF